MKIFPAIDIIGGEVVRLTKGDYGQVKKYALSVEEAAKSFYADGARCVHIVDRAGAKSGVAENAEAVKKILSSAPLFAEVGGGIRTEKQIEEYLSCGAGRVILGTVAVKKFSFVEEMAKKYPEKIAVGVDALNGCVAVSGWREVTDIDSVRFCEKVRDAGVKYVIYTDIGKDGMLGGTNLEIYRKLSEIKGLNITASGGITFAEEIKQLKKTGVYGAILGKAMYENKLSLKDAVKAAEM